jgi:hypothetical protein
VWELTFAKRLVGLLPRWGCDEARTGKNTRDMTTHVVRAPNPRFSNAQAVYVFFSQKLFIRSFFKRQFPHRSVNLFFVQVAMKAKLTDLCGNCLLRNHFMNTFCEIRLGGFTGERIPAHPPPRFRLARFGDTTPCRTTGVTLHGFVSPVTPVILHGVLSLCKVTPVILHGVLSLCKATLVILHGVVSPCNVTPVIPHGVVFPCKATLVILHGVVFLCKVTPVIPHGVVSLCKVTPVILHWVVSLCKGTPVIPH